MLHGSHARASELKQQGALEAARNPEASITAEDAEQKLLDEAHRSGAAAFQFDPDADPEEKARQIAAVSLPTAERDTRREQ